MHEASFLGLSLDEWQIAASFATVLALVVGVAAVVGAFRTVAQTAQTRLDESRPYVLASLQRGEVALQLMDLVIENVGAGPAYDVKVAVDPPMVRVAENSGYEANPLMDARVFRHGFAMIPPHLTHKFFFDESSERYARRHEVPMQFEMTISYHDGRGHSWTDKFALDADYGDGLIYTVVLGNHDIAKRLKDIHNDLGNLTRAMAKRQAD